MAYEYEGTAIKITLTAGADLSADQFKFVEITSANTVTLCNLVTDRPIGILLNKPDAAGKAAEVLMAGVSQLVASGAIVAGWSLGTAVGGTAARNVGSEVGGGGSANPTVGIALTASGGAGEIITAAINCLNSQVCG